MLSVANYLKCLSKVEKLFCLASWIHCDFTPLFGSFCLFLGELKKYSQTVSWGSNHQLEVDCLFDVVGEHLRRFAISGPFVLFQISS